MSLIVSNGTAEGTVLYRYNPSDTTGYAFVGLFGIATVCHIVLMIYHRTAHFIPMIVGGVMEAGGFYGRAWGHDNPKLLKAYVLYLLLTLSAPPFFAATIYMALSQIIITLKATNLSIFSVRWLTTVFVMIDIVCFIAFIGGAGMQVAVSAKVNDIGIKVLLGGLIFQIICFVIFIYIAVNFHKRTARFMAAHDQGSNIKWRRHLWTLYIACLFILVRNIFRIAEYAQGHNGAIAHSEAYIYVFEAGPMWFVMVVYAVIHPGQLVRNVRAVEERKNEGEELTEVRAEQETGIHPWS